MAVTELVHEGEDFGAGAFLVGLVLVGLISLQPDVTLQERADGHADAKHGESAKVFVQNQRRMDLDVWFSATTETAMIVGCDCQTGVCANVIVGMRGVPMAPGAEVWAAMAGRLELTHLWRTSSRMASALERDRYVRVYPPAPLSVIPPVWERCGR